MKITINKKVTGFTANKQYTVFADLNNSKKSQVVYDDFNNEVPLSSLEGFFVDDVLLVAMTEDAKNYLTDYIAANGESSVTVNAQKRIDAMVVRYNNA